MKTPVDLFRRGYELLVSGANVLQSPFLLLLRIYFFWQLFQTGQGKLAHIEKISDYFASLGIPLADFECLYGRCDGDIWQLAINYRACLPIDRNPNNGGYGCSLSDGRSRSSHWHLQ